MSKQVFFQEFCIMLLLNFFAKKYFLYLCGYLALLYVSVGWPDHYKNKFSISRRDVWYPQVHCKKSSMYFDMWEVFFGISNFFFVIWKICYNSLVLQTNTEKQTEFSNARELIHKMNFFLEKIMDKTKILLKKVVSMK